MILALWLLRHTRGNLLSLNGIRRRQSPHRGQPKVRLEYEQGIPREDRYGRTLAYVYLEGGRLLDLEIIEQGYGFAYTKYPFSKMEEFRAAERYAREAQRGLRSDNGPEFVSRAVLQWLQEAGIETAPIDPGKPWQNDSNESFNGKFRDECLGMQWFKNRIDAKVVIEGWRKMYNGVRPHSSLNNLTPNEYARGISTTSPEQAIF